MEKEIFKVTINLLRDGESVCLSDKKLAEALDNLNYLESQTANSCDCYTSDAMNASECIRKIICALSEDIYLYNTYTSNKNHETQAPAT